MWDTPNTPTGEKIGFESNHRPQTIQRHLPSLVNPLLVLYKTGQIGGPGPDVPDFFVGSLRGSVGDAQVSQGGGNEGIPWYRNKERTVTRWVAQEWGCHGFTEV